VLVGTGNLAHVFGNSGYIHAYDLHTGESRWSFQVVEEGFWGDPLLNSGGGVWYPPAIDEERGLAYFGTGNAGPYPGTVQYPNGSSRPGPNLYTSSLVALNLRTGELEWHYQAVEHGLFDLDFQSSPILATHTDEDGATRDLVVGSGKLGRVIALDRESHDVVWETEVGIHQNDDVEEIAPGELLEVYPGVFGGVETPMAAAAGRIFVPVVNLPTTHTSTGHGATDGSSALLNATANTPMSQGTGELIALDVLTGDVLWSVPLDTMPFGGATVVGDLVFTATFEGVIRAHRVADGLEVWRFQASGGINAWPAVQDDTILWPVGLGPNPSLIALRLAEEDIAAGTP
jgi:glucose dehydrogenase